MKLEGSPDVAGGLLLKKCGSNVDYDRAKELFREYAGSLEIDLCFQNFEQELQLLPTMYGAPGGQLLLAFQDQLTAGCVGMRQIDEISCEMKRLYVRPAFRGRGVGRLLAREIIRCADAAGYHRMRLDTLSSMKEARALYASLGFTRIEPYYCNPSPDAVFLELKIVHAPQSDQTR